MPRYCAFLPVESPELTLIEELRGRFDPLAGVVPAHVTIGRYTAASRYGCEQEVARLSLPVPISIPRRAIFLLSAK